MVMTGIAMLNMWVDDPGALSSGNSRLLMIFVGIVAFCFLVQAIVWVGLAVGAMKLSKKVMGITDDLHRRALPIIGSAEHLLQETAPKIRVVTDNIVETSHLVRNKVTEFDATLSDANKTFVDANNKTRAQVARVDGMVSSALTRTASLGDMIHDSIRTPVKQVAGVVSGLKVGLDVLLGKGKPNGSYRGPGI